MAAPIDPRTLRAAALLQSPHPKHPSRNYSVAEAAKKTGIHRSTLYNHLKRQEKSK